MTCRRSALQVVRLARHDANPSLVAPTTVTSDVIFNGLPCADRYYAVWRYTQSTRASNRDLLYDQWDQFKQFAAYLQSIEVSEDAATADDDEQSPEEKQPKKQPKSKRKGEVSAKKKVKKQSKSVVTEDDDIEAKKPRKKRKKL